MKHDKRNRTGYPVFLPILSDYLVYCKSGDNPMTPTEQITAMRDSLARKMGREDIPPALFLDAWSVTQELYLQGMSASNAVFAGLKSVQNHEPE